MDGRAYGDELAAERVLAAHARPARPGGPCSCGWVPWSQQHFAAGFAAELARKWSPEAVEAAMEGPAGVSGCPGEGGGSERLMEAFLADVQTMGDALDRGDPDGMKAGWEAWRRIRPRVRAGEGEGLREALRAVLDDEPLIVDAIRRDLERTPQGRGGELAAIPATPRHGRSGCPGDNLTGWIDRLRALLDQPTEDCDHGGSPGVTECRYCRNDQPIEDRHPEDYCHCCGGPNPSWYAPSPLWNRVMGYPDQAYDGIVCPPCFAVLARAVGIDGTWRWSQAKEPEGLSYTHVDGRLWDADRDLWVEPTGEPQPEAGGQRG